MAAPRPGFIDPEAYYDPFEFLAELDRRKATRVSCTEDVS
ncbi:hypothetical protein DSM104329_02125 [Capillimicrobium parvum]|uniref:Uncharacterized protein n=1 Tax=Capillimicrobium parvum TaxID=2884022 RepID=A0A9E7BZU3_9ACTN|nr:hypothetical protein DSM104329_02125 [Capillimicrobium parvum]